MVNLQKHSNRGEDPGRQYVQAVSAGSVQTLNLPKPQPQGNKPATIPAAADKKKP